MNTPGRPTSATGRIRSLDCLRGLAIIGTLGTNIWGFSYLGGDLEVLFGPKEWWANLDDLLLSLTLFFTNGKFLGLLAMLFGVGLELQRQSAARAGRPFLTPYAWRNLLLLAIGFAHFALVYGYDILMGYALASLVVMGLAVGGRRRLLTGMVIAGLMHLLVYGLFCLAMNPAGQDPAAGYISQILATGTYLETVQLRLNLVAYFRFEVVSLLGLNTVLMGCGVLMVRAGLFEDSERGRALIRRLLVIGLAIGVPLNLLSFYPDARVALATRYFLAPLMSLAYLALGVWLFRHGQGLITRSLEVVGRTALSCYILQNFIAALLFYGWGLGLKGQFGAPGTLLTWLLISSGYIALMALWLRRFHQGPVEWAWRKMS